MRFNILKKITYNWHIKLISVVLASILWVYVDSLKQTDRFISVPVEIKNIPAGYMVSNNLPSAVKIIMRGKESRLALLDENYIRAYVDLENSAGGDKRHTVRVDKNQIPQGVSIKEISPRFIDITVEKVEKKYVRVIPVITHEPPDGYIFEDVQIEPESVLIKGPESLMKNIDSVYTKDININNLTETTMKEVELDIRDGKILPENDSVVNVKIIIREQYVVKKVIKNEIIPLNLTENLTTEILGGPATVLLRLPKRIEKEFSADQFILYVDLEGINEPGVHTLPIVFETNRRDVYLIKIEPEAVDVELKIAEQM